MLYLLPKYLFVAIELFSLSGSLFVILCFFDVLFGGDDFATSDEAIRVIADVIKRAGKDRGVLLDLGSCRGTFGISLQKIMPDLSIVCVDNSFIRVATSMFRKPLFAKGPKFLYGDLFKTSISNVDILNVYLPQEMTKTLIDKIRAESRSTTIVVMYRIELEDLPYKERIYLGRPSEIRNRVTVYEF